MQNETPGICVKEVLGLAGVGFHSLQIAMVWLLTNSRAISSEDHCEVSPRRAGNWEKTV
jgi:hypothetical protein